MLAALQRSSAIEQWHQIRDTVSLSAIAGQSLKLTNCGTEWKACCPFHPDRSPSFTIYAGDRRFMCFGCGAQGDALDFVMRLHGVPIGEALRLLGQSNATHVMVGSSERRDGRVLEARAMWRASQPAGGTPAERYLRLRGIRTPLPSSIRFTHLPFGRASTPVLVAGVSSANGQITGVQRTYLAPDGSAKAQLPGGKTKLSLGAIKGGAIRLAPAARELIVTEGLEDGLTLQQELGQPVWVAAGASMLPFMTLPDCVTTVIIGADADAAGEAAANRAAEAFSSQKRRVRILRPHAGYKDFNDQLRGIRL